METTVKMQRYCSKCRKTLNETNFYTYKDGTRCELCKACLTMHVNNFEPETFLWILEKFDVPYVEEEWNILRDRAYQKDPYKMTGMSVLGRYFSKMKLIQWKDYHWADNERIKFEREKKAEELGSKKEQREKVLEQIKEAYENGEITEAQYKTYFGQEAPEQNGTPQVINGGYGEISTSPNLSPVDYSKVVGKQDKKSDYPVNNPFEVVELEDVGEQLTQEDKVYLAMKWGKFYRADEWVSLETLYEDFMKSFDIQGAGRVDTLKMICKTSLKMNQAIDCGDIETYQKLSRVYDTMMKSGRFTEAQNKEEETNLVNSVSQLVYYCEKEGGAIPRFKIVEDKDTVDLVIRDLKEYNKSLIYEDKSLAQEIEQYLRNRKTIEQMRLEKEELREKGLAEFEYELTDKDHKNFYDMIEKEQEEDDEFYYEGED